MIRSTEIQNQIENVVTKGRGYNPISNFWKDLTYGDSFLDIVHSLRKAIIITRSDLMSYLAASEAKDLSGLKNSESERERYHLERCSKFLYNRPLFFLNNKRLNAFRKLAENAGTFFYINNSHLKKYIKATKNLLDVEEHERDNYEWAIT